MIVMLILGDRSLVLTCLTLGSEEERMVVRRNSHSCNSGISSHMRVDRIPQSVLR